MKTSFIIAFTLFLTACAQLCPPPEVPAPPAPTVEDAQLFMDEVESNLLELWVASERSMWVNATFITFDTELLVARVSAELMAFVSEKVAEAQKFEGLEMSKELARKFELLGLSLTLPAPSDEAKRNELAEIAARMKGTYGKGKYCAEGKECKDLGELSKVIGESRDFEHLKEAWVGWRTISKPIRKDYERFTQLGNEGAKELGFDDLGAMWRSNYDMTPSEFEDELDRLWFQVKPLYDQLHCYTRTQLQKKYGEDNVSSDGLISAHLLGNMWSQDWMNIYDLLQPEQNDSFNMTKILQDQNLDEVKIVKQAEAFFVSLGLDPLPESFWERSMFTKPADREVVCHASAWDIDWKDDLRIKMCIKVDGEDFTTIHHELGHNYYQRAYNKQPALFTDSANDGFHEAIGDTIALSVTPAYLKKIGYIDELPPKNLNPLMRRALDKIAFLPFGLIVDKWRWDVFSGKVDSSKYNEHWWNLRTQYQGIVPPVERTEDDFDPGAKYHVPGNTPYTRYFLAAILQFQFHRALCKKAGHEGPLHECSIYGSKEAGEALNKMMKMGSSKPWPKALKAITGEKQMDATAIIDYFQPLLTWLEEQNKDAKCGW